jgi:hypothetical protein
MSELTLQVVHGNPTPEELAAATAVLMARLQRRPAAAPVRPQPLPLVRRRTTWRMSTVYRAPAAWATAR